MQTISLNVGRIRTVEGGYEVIGDAGEVMRERDGTPFKTLERVEEVLDWIERMKVEN